MHRQTSRLISLDQRGRLRERLRQLAGSSSAGTELIEGRIDALLEEILEESPFVEPLELIETTREEEQRVVVTGMGAVTPLGVTMQSMWEGLIAGRSGIGPLTQCDPGELSSRIAGEVRGFDPQLYLEAKEARRLSRASQFAIAAARMALHDSGLQLVDAQRTEYGALIASGDSSMPDVEAQARVLFEKGPNRVSPFFMPAALPSMPSSQVAIHLGLQGYNTTICTACAASAQAIGEAAEVIRRGEAQVMFAGGSEAPLSQFGIAAFTALRALSTRNHQPERASRPFDAQRDGFVIAEGAGVLVLESLAHARQRNARIYAELLGYASSCDAYHVTAPDPHGAGAARAIARALVNAQISPRQVDYINAHATSTSLGDIAETRAIKQVFDEYAHSVPVSSSKSMLGHLTSAAGAVEAIISILALEHGIIPPTINYETPDPECDLDYVPNTARRAALQVAISNSFGFGGINAVLVFRKLPPTL